MGITRTAVMSSGKRLLRRRLRGVRRNAHALLSARVRSARKASVPWDKATLRTHGCLALDWLLVSGRACGNAGVAIALDLLRGWSGPYVEVTGYSLRTMRQASLMLGHKTAQCAAFHRASSDWLLTCQHDDGSFPGSHGGPAVFDTGQVIFGLLDAAKEYEDERFLFAADRAADWMTAMQEQDGSWVRGAYSGIAHTYYTRAAWGLAEAGARLGKDRYLDAAQRNLTWALSRQHADGWFDSCSFLSDDRPVLHVLAYTIEGLWRTGILLNDLGAQHGALAAASALALDQAESGRLGNHYSARWQREDSSMCVTGSAQMASVWLDMDAAGSLQGFGTSAEIALDAVAACQINTPSLPALHGGLPGSVPWSGEYFPWACPSWGAKFFLDALMGLWDLESPGG